MEYTDPVRPTQQPWMWCDLTRFRKGGKILCAVQSPKVLLGKNDYEILKRGKRIKVYEYTHIHAFLKGKITRG